MLVLCFTGGSLVRANATALVLWLRRGGEQEAQKAIPWPLQISGNFSLSLSNLEATEEA